jgi:DNA mismatch repair protein MutL
MAADRVVLLDENTANQIAAGEVVERPASAVKELVENAVDAGATQIVVALEDGGKQSIIVSDNGSGMTRSDAILSLQRHATSKIRTADDLFAIRTLGFRGEAMPSIASVSRMTITTKPADEESGTRLVIVGGDIQSVEETAARDGTTIEVSELFFNTPARMKFLKSTPTEVARVVEIVGQLAVAYPAIAFRLRQGTQEAFATPGTGEPLAALAAVWGRDIARKLIPIRHEGGGLNVTGFVATPDTSRPGRSHELIFVNRRPIKSRLIGHALEEAFRALTPDSRYPIGAISVEIHPDLVDVNVHPTKTEVKFTRDGEVHHAVSQAVKGALLAYGIVPQARITTPVSTTLQTPQTTLGFSSSTPNATTASPFHDAASAFATAIAGFMPLETFADAALDVNREANREAATSNVPDPFSPSEMRNTADGVDAENGSATHNIDTKNSENNAGSAYASSERGPDTATEPDSGASEIHASRSDKGENSDLHAETANDVPADGAQNQGDSSVENTPQTEEWQVRPRPRPFAEQLREFKVLGQARNTYIIALTPNGIAVIDQHVAHERVLYERLTVKRFANGIPVQRLTIPITVNLGRREALLLAEHCDSFTQAGWDIAAFGKDSFVVRSVPAMLVNKPYEKILRDMIDELVNQTVSRRLLVQQEHVTITNACKMAVKAGDPMNLEEMQGLLEQLAETENPYLCPHGRPIVVTISFHELDKQFKRA